VFRGGAIGDFILTVPAIAALRQRFPGAWIEVFGYPHIARLAQAAGLVHRVQDLEAQPVARLFATDGELSPELRACLSGFDLVVSYLSDPDATLQRNVRAQMQGCFIQGPHRPEQAQRLHATQAYLRPLEQLGILKADPVARLSIRRQAPTRKLAVHPGSGSERKNWPEAQWRQLMGRLIECSPIDLLLVGGEAEGRRLERLAEGMPVERFELAKNVPLVELAERIQSCVAFVGHDSGITHLAAAVGVPCLALWGDTCEEIWRPLGERVTLLKEGAGLAHLSVERVASAIRTLLSSCP